MAFRTSAQLQLLSLLLGLSSLDKSGAGAQEFQLLQPQGAVSVSPGENLTLICSVTGLQPVGPVKWFKGSGSGRQLVYADVGSFPRVTRAVNHSDTDFTIRINDTRPEDAGIYRCVKFRKGSGADEEFRSGAGTVVSVSGYSQGSAVAAAAGTVCVLLVVLLLVFTYFFVRKKRGRSPGTARSQTPFPKNRRTQSQPGDSKDPDVLYADLQHTAGLQQPKKSAPEEHSEYAAVKVTQAIAR
ncbi:tyrosine-protein phosphatase non-receptor type substrate 1-like isoform X2 [Chrysemys picta bellii]|uniref:tyrosine-protein phosphatase non-receptor type substrate 1-like isoform X2 n=1 Tax=Chrysemys picta bellii TaxID=8478 RepID=UPI0032B2608E